MLNQKDSFFGNNEFCQNSFDLTLCNDPFLEITTFIFRRARKGTNQRPFPFIFQVGACALDLEAQFELPCRSERLCCVSDGYVWVAQRLAVIVRVCSSSRRSRLRLNFERRWWVLVGSVVVLRLCDDFFASKRPNQRLLRGCTTELTPAPPDSFFEKIILIWTYFRFRRRPFFTRNNDHFKNVLIWRSVISFQVNLNIPAVFASHSTA